EIWSLYQSGKLHPESKLSGHFEHNEKPANVGNVMRIVANVLKKEAALQRYKQAMRR
ncbi:RIO kinase 1, partial [Nitrosospira sp. Nl5]